MDHDAEFVPLEVNAIIPNAESVQSLSRPLQFPEALQFRAHDFLGQPTKFAEDRQLKFLRHPRQLRRAGRIKDDLKRTHQRTCNVSGSTFKVYFRLWYGARVRLTARSAVGA